MIVLGIETATAVCGASVVENGNILSHFAIEEQHIHAEKLLTIVDKALRAAKVSLSQLDGIAISIGPGSFTGLRIGLSTAKGLAYASGTLLIAVPTLEGLAWNARILHIVWNQTILPMVNARKNEVYWALYRNEPSGIAVIKSVQAMSLEHIEQYIGNEDNILVVGDGADKFQTFLMSTERTFSERFIIPEREKRLCSAISIALLGEQKLQQGECSNFASLEPFYAKDFNVLMKTQHQSVC